MKKFIAAMMLAGAVAGLPTSAQAQGIGVELTAGKAEGIWGAELGLGYAFELGPIAVRPVAGAFIYKGDNTRYYMDQMSNGQSRCRDNSNGQFAKTALCNDAAAMFYGKVEAAVPFRGSLRSEPVQDTWTAKCGPTALWRYHLGPSSN